MVTAESAASKSFQEEMLEFQNFKWSFFEEHLEVVGRNIHLLSDYDQLTFSEQSMNSN